MKTEQLISTLRLTTKARCDEPDSAPVPFTLGTLRAVIRHLELPKTVTEEGFGVEPDFSEPGY